MDQEFYAVLQAHRTRYPLMAPQDWGKLAYQSEYGPEHMAPDYGQVLDALLMEWGQGAGEAESRPPEYIGNGLCRFHLTGEYDPALAAPLLARLFLLTAQTRGGTAAGLRDRLELLGTLDLPGMEGWLEEYRRQGCPPVRHSRQFRDAYRPHYRLLGRDLGGCFPVLMKIAQLSASGRNTLVAIDGRCGSGKTRLAGLIARMFPCNVFHMDDYYLPLERRKPDWEQSPGGNMDFNRVAREVLSPARAGCAVTCRPYDCQSGAWKTPVHVLACPLTIVEGSYSHHPALAGCYDWKVFLTCSGEEQARRLKAREGARYADFERRWIPMEERYFQRCGVEGGSGLVVDTSLF